MYRVIFNARAKAYFEDAQVPLQRKLNRFVELIMAEPRRHPNTKRLSGVLADYYRFRVGDYRVLYRIDDQDGIIYIDKIAHRSEVYE